MKDAERKAAAKKFADYWKDKGYEKGESQKFWLSLLQNVYGVEDVEQYITFEENTHIDRTSFIDGMIPTTLVMIEQKSSGKNLKAPIRQSDGTKLTPFQQAKRYCTTLPRSQYPKWIITCNFQEFYIYNMEDPLGKPEILELANLPDEIYRLQFLVDTGSDDIKKEMRVSLKAGELVGKLYDEILKQYIRPEDPHSLKSLNMLCVRLVFCLYAEDAGLFGGHGKFHDYLQSFPPRDVRTALIDLFRVLDTKPNDRDPYLRPDLAAFPYVNGGLFSDMNIEIPNFTQPICDLLLKDASENFDWSAISPTIFGAVFESTLNPETRRSGGMHYTSIENIHKVIDPLFLDELKKELAEVKAVPIDTEREKKLKAFQRKLSQLTFLDPACGSGNFLTETYLSLRRLENEVLRGIIDAKKKVVNGQIVFGDQRGNNPIQVSIGQFYGIEINDFAVTVARTALWIAESQMMKETEEVISMELDFFPLKSYPNINEGNALRMDWESVVPKAKLNYIMGNPPFVGYSFQSKEQKADIRNIYTDEKGKPYKTAGKIDYVAAWYFKASRLMQGTEIRAAFVSTNSITQGEQVAAVWEPLYERFQIHIDFAYRTFKWGSEAKEKAAVHCVIVGFSQAANPAAKRIFGKDSVAHEAENINPYLINAPVVFVKSRNKPLCDVPQMTTGNRPADSGHLIIEADEYDGFLEAEPNAKSYIKRFMGSEEFINNKKRWCLWLVNTSPAELRKMPLVMKRVELCKQDRLSSPDKGRQKLALTPTLFRETQNPVKFVVIPKVSSARRRYIPIDYLSADTIPSDLLFIVSNSEIYHFGVLTSNVHMAWMRAVCGRLKSDYRYSATVVYNNFPWPAPTDVQKAKIERTAQSILDARALYPDCSLADLYDDTAMPPELRTAHQNNDRAVMETYGFSVKTMTEESCVAELMKMYQKLAEKADRKA